ncbi:MAG TPA: hypothetical protein VKA49_01340 [Flavitalea sp.]|nr:hypothetical protein [Flavitalea sp.]
MEEKYFASGETAKETYEKFMAKFAEEKAEILSTLRNTAVTSSNLENYLKTVAPFSSKLTTT